MSHLDAVKQFLTLRDSIASERESILNRLREIDAAIGSAGLYGKDSYYGPRTGPRNEMSLKDLVLKVIEGKSLTKHEILDVVLASGYEFRTADPLNSLGVILYGKKPKFKNDKGRFSIP